MKVNQIIELDIVTDETKIFIRDENSKLLAKGKWFNNCVLDCLNYEVKSFTWQDDNRIYVDVKIGDSL